MAHRSVFSVQLELLDKSKEAALNAVQTFNNPLTRFKTETFIVLMTIAWTYLMHAYYRREGIEYRYYTQGKHRRRFDRTKSGAFKYWELERCLNEQQCPLDAPTKANLRFLIGLRHEIEHHMPTGLDTQVSGRYLACCLNYETTVTRLFGDEHSLGAAFGITLQFRDLLAQPKADGVSEPLPANVTKYISQFDDDLPDTDYRSPSFSYGIIFTRRLANHRGQADEAIEFIGADTQLAEEIDKQYWVLKETERPKFRPKEVIERMKSEGFLRFGQHQHTLLWQAVDAKNPSKGYGVEVSGQWYWYERWVDRVREHCLENSEKYGPVPDLGLSA